MAKDNVPTYQEWLKDRQNQTNENRARAQAFHDGNPVQDRWLWAWFRDSFLEINMIYNALEWANNYQLEADSKIMQALRENYKKTEQVLKTLLGLDYSATQQDIEERAKVLGNLVEGLIDKSKQIEEDEQKLKNKVFKEK